MSYWDQEGEIKSKESIKAPKKIRRRKIIAKQKNANWL